MRISIPNENSVSYLDEYKDMRVFENIPSNIEKYALEDNVDIKTYYTEVH